MKSSRRSPRRPSPTRAPFRRRARSVAWSVSIDQPPKLLDRLPSLPPRPSSKTNIPAQGKGTQARDEAARKRLTARLEAMSAAALDPPAVNPRTAAVAALMVANFASDEAVRKRFAPLIGAKLFDGNALEDLPVAARFVLRILPKLGPELDQRDTFPMVSLLAQVKALKEDLLRTVGRYLEDIDDAHGRIVTIRLGEGSADDVYNLRMLADLWRDYAETLHTEAGAAYRPEAEREARELATHLELALLGPLSEEDDEWRSYLHRALAMLVPLYDEVCRAGRFLFHHEKPEARFPTLASVARVRRRLRKEASQAHRSQPVLQAAPSPSSKPGSVPPENLAGGGVGPGQGGARGRDGRGPEPLERAEHRGPPCPASPCLTRRPRPLRATTTRCRA